MYPGSPHHLRILWENLGLSDPKLLCQLPAGTPERSLLLLNETFVSILGLDHKYHPVFWAICHACNH